MEEDTKKDFRGAINNCRACRNYCAKENLYEENVHSRQALIYLSYIKNSLIARAAEYKCNNECNHKSTGIISVIESSDIDLH